MQLSEATLHDICTELSKRNLSFIFIAQYYSGAPQDITPFFSFGVRREDICHMIGLNSIAQNQLQAEFQKLTSIIPEDENEDEFGDKENSR